MKIIGIESVVLSIPTRKPMALDDRITESVSKVAILTAALRRGVLP